MDEIMKTHFDHDSPIPNGFFALRPDEWYCLVFFLIISHGKQLVKKALQKLTLFLMMYCIGHREYISYLYYPQIQMSTNVHTICEGKWPKDIIGAVHHSVYWTFYKKARLLKPNWWSFARLLKVVRIIALNISCFVGQKHTCEDISRCGWGHGRTIATRTPWLSYVQPQCLQHFPSLRHLPVLYIEGFPELKCPFICSI